MKNQTGKYVKYAIGEIILVVIGILIALQINNWNEQRKTVVRSQEYLNEIVNDIIADTLNIKTLIDRGEQSTKDINQYLQFFNEGDHSIDELIDRIELVNRNFIRYFPAKNTLTDMQSSGNMNLLTRPQHNALIELSNEQEQLIIIIEKTISSAIAVGNISDRYLGFPDNYYQKLNKVPNDEQKEKWLLYKHLELEKCLSLYTYIANRGNRITEMSKRTIWLLNNKD